MGLRSFAALAILVAGVLGYRVLDQGRQIDRLDRELQALRQSVHARAQDEELAIPIADSPIYAPVAKYVEPIEQDAPAGAEAEAPGAAAGSGAVARSARRVPVTHDEVAHVESAVLSLLEADRPELRAKLRAVVQEQQQTFVEQQREERRERWATRLEARLLELGPEVGLTDDQRQALLHIMLATRDEISDVMQSAQTPQAINEGRSKARALQEQSDAQIRQLLKPEQYEAYRAQFPADDSDRRSRGAGADRTRGSP